VRWLRSSLQANNLLCYDQYCSNYVHAIDVLIKLNKNATYSAEIEVRESHCVMF